MNAALLVARLKERILESSTASNSDVLFAGHAEHMFEPLVLETTH